MFLMSLYFVMFVYIFLIVIVGGLFFSGLTMGRYAILGTKCVCHEAFPYWQAIIT